MSESISRSSHTFYIPVMGTAFTIDTPLHVAKYGISSVISLVDDILLEKMRKFHAERSGEPYEEISMEEEDWRARRTTAYLNLINKLVAQQVRELQASPFEKDSEITRYYELLPDSPLKRDYEDMLKCKDPDMKSSMQETLRQRAVPGSIDANIMTKVDRDVYKNGTKLPSEYNDAMAAFRGYAKSDVDSCLILSAGFNPRLYNYIPQFKDFYPDSSGKRKKRIILKVSDYRSAEIQGKYFAKKGLWVSEFRIESGLNCGGHTFASTGYLLGPILTEFMEKKQDLINTLNTIYIKALARLGHPVNAPVPETRITVQGGIGTASENQMMLNYYKVDGTGWGTPFLLVPSVVNIDDVHLEKLLHASDKDVYLSDSSPFGVPFWNLYGSASEETRRKRLADGKPGALCTNGYLKLNTEFTKLPVCISSRTYIKQKLPDLKKQGYTEKQYAVVEKRILDKSCICHDLAGAATLRLNIDPKAKPAICCGPNIINFSKISTLEEMVAHIYGNLNLITNSERPHMFIKELMLYMEYLRKELDMYKLELSARAPKYFHEFKNNLLNGIDQYQKVAEQFIEEKKSRFLSDLKTLREELENLPLINEGS